MNLVMNYFDHGVGRESIIAHEMKDSSMLGKPCIVNFFPSMQTQLSVPLSLKIWSAAVA